MIKETFHFYNIGLFSKIGDNVDMTFYEFCFAFKVNIVEKCLKIVIKL